MCLVCLHYVNLNEEVKHSRKITNKQIFVKKHCVLKKVVIIEYLINVYSNLYKVPAILLSLIVAKLVLYK